MVIAICFVRCSFDRFDWFIRLVDRFVDRMKSNGQLGRCSIDLDQKLISVRASLREERRNEIVGKLFCFLLWVVIAAAIRFEFLELVRHVIPVLLKHPSVRMQQQKDIIAARKDVKNPYINTILRKAFASREIPVKIAKELNLKHVRGIGVKKKW